MIKTIKKLITMLSMSVLFAVPVMVPVVAHAQINPDCGGIQACLDNGSCNTDTAGCANNDPTGKVNSIIKLVINIFSLVVGVIAVVMIIIGGLKYITSGGDSGNITGAKNTILYAIIGLVVVALAQIVVQFVLKRVTQ